MEKKDNSQKGQELLNIDEKGKPLEKKEEKNQQKIQKFSLMYTCNISWRVLLGLFLRIFVFNKNIEKTKDYHKYKTTENMYRNLGEAIIRYIKQKTKC